MIRSAALVALLAGANLLAAPFHVSRLDGPSETVDPSASDATVIVFVSTLCPFSNAYMDRFQALYSTLRGKPVRFLLVNSNENESAADVRNHLAGSPLSVPVYKDWSNALADRFNARLTPEAVVLDRNGAVVYQGAWDDARNAARVKVHAVRDVVERLLAGRQPAVAPIRAFGCSIKRVRPVDE